MSTSPQRTSNITAILKNNLVSASLKLGNHADLAPSSDRTPSVAVGVPKLQINHFLSRGNGILVPVIPLDELPLQLHGVPQCLSWEATRGMAFLGEIRSSKTMFSISTTSNSQDASIEPAEQADEGYDTGEDFIPSSETAFPTMTALQLSIQSALTEAEWEADPHADLDEDYAEHARIIEAQQHNFTFPFSIPSTPKPVVILPRPVAGRSSADVHRDHLPFMPSTTSQRPLPPSGLEPDESLKEYCTYWIRTGECAYTQQGCKYKHEMPPNKSTLLKVFGTDVWPKWWIEREHEHKLRNRGYTSGSGERMSPPKYPQPSAGRRDMMTGSSWRPDVGRKPTTPITAFSAAARAQPMGRGGRRSSNDKPSQQPRMDGVNNQNSMTNKRFETRKAAVDASKSFNRFVLPIDAILKDPFLSRSASPQTAAGMDDALTDLGSDYQPLQPMQPWKADDQSNERPAQTKGITYTSGSPRKISFPKLFVSRSQESAGNKSGERSAGSLSSAGGTDVENSGSSTDVAARELQGESVSKKKHRSKEHRKDKSRQAQKKKHVDGEKPKGKTTVSKE